jgi:hypothetical protein
MQAASIKAEAPRAWFHRAASAGVVVLGALLWIGGLHLTYLLSQIFCGVYLKFDIKGGLPLPTEAAFSILNAYGSHRPEVIAGAAVAACGLAVILASVRSRRAFRVAGWFAVGCFVLWYLAQFILFVCYMLPLQTCDNW